MNPKTLIIAEAGVNHNGEMALAKKLIDVAAKSGADYIKFQTFSADRLVTPSAPKANYQILSTGKNEAQIEMLRRLEFNRSNYCELIKYCEKCGIKFLSTAFDIESIKMLVSLDVNIIKIPSGEITNSPYLKYVGSLGLPTIMSTGMATIGEIESAVELIVQAGLDRKKISLLHCTTEYPTPMAEVNLRAMNSMRTTFGLNIGYSDHTLGIEIPIAAVSLGATIIEKHFTLDRGLDGPDHKASLEPEELKAMVKSIRNIEIALGDGLKQPTPSELRNRQLARKSIVARIDIKAGDVFSIDNLTVKRPGDGISPMRWDEIIGRYSPRKFNKDDPIIL